jgi:hypothetical protein
MDRRGNHSTARILRATDALGQTSGENFPLSTCECGLTGNQHDSSEMGIDGRLVHVPLTKGGTTWVVVCSQVLHFLQMKEVGLPFL